MTKVVLHGELGTKFNKEYKLAVDSPIEAIRALSALVPNFKEEFQKGNYYLYLGDKSDRINLDEDNVKLKSNLPIHIVPEVVGAKDKGVGKLLAGIALIGVAFIPGLNAAVFGALQGLAGGIAGGQGVLAAHAVAQVSASAAFFGGLQLALGGAAQMMAPKVGSSKESNLFSGAPDSVTEGTPVPLVYGDYLAIGYPVSFELINGMNAHSSVNGNTGGGGASGDTGGWTTVNTVLDF